MSPSSEDETRRRGYQRRIPGETLALHHLRQKGYVILARNFRTTRGEVDIVCEDHKTIVFVEVKGWRNFGVPDLEYAISLRKRKRIVATAQRYLAYFGIEQPESVRFDVIFVDTKSGRIEHFQGAFDSPWQG